MMGLLDQIAGQVLGQVLGGGGAAAGGQQNALMQLVLGLIQNNGGLGALLGQLQRAGLGQQASSWVSTGENQPVDGGQLENVFGPEAIGRWASELGLSLQETSGALAQMLPQVVDRLTPGGQVTEGAELQDLVGQLAGSFLNRT